MEFPNVNTIVNRDIYVDDCISGEATIEAAMKTADEETNAADEMENVLRKSGFGFKGFTFSGKDPLEKLSSDGESISIGGLIWHPKSYAVSIDVPPLNFAKKQHGKKAINEVGVVPEKLIRRQCISKGSELFDITGKLTPVTAAPSNLEV